jgi:hypothetical protein
MARCEQLLGEAPDAVGTAYLHTFVGGLAAQLGDFERARALVASAGNALEDRGHRGGAGYCSRSGEIRLRVIRRCSDPQEFQQPREGDQSASRAQ